MPLIKRSGKRLEGSTTAIRKRKHTQKMEYGRYIYKENGSTVIRTPAECASWHTDLRLRIVTSYFAPHTPLPLSSLENIYAISCPQTQVYKAQGRRFYILNPTTKAVRDNGKEYALMLGTFLHDIESRKVLRIVSDNAAMRILFVYSFLTGKRVSALPPLDVRGIHDYIDYTKGD